MDACNIGKRRKKMKLSHVYKGFAVYRNEDGSVFAIDGYEEEFSNQSDVQKFIDKLKMFSFLEDKAVGYLYKLGYYRKSFGVEYENLVKEEKWSNDKAVITFFYDSWDVEIEGRINSVELEKIMRHVFDHSKPKKEDIEVVYNIVKGNLNGNQVKKGKIKDINKLSETIARGVISQMAYTHS